MLEKAPSSPGFLMMFYDIPTDTIGGVLLHITDLSCVFIERFYITFSAVEFKGRTIELDGTKTKLQMWDTNGRKSFQRVSRHYYPDAHGFFIVYDVTNKQSFDSIKYWMREIRDHASRDLDMMILGNKCDMNDKREVMGYFLLTHNSLTPA